MSSEVCRICGCYHNATTCPPKTPEQIAAALKLAEERDRERYEPADTEVKVNDVLEFTGPITSRLEVERINTMIGGSRHALGPDPENLGRRLSLELRPENFWPGRWRIMKRREKPRPNKAAAERMVAEAMAWAEQKKKEGWTREDFIRGFKQFMENPDAPDILDGKRP